MIEERTIGTSLLLTDLFKSSSVEELHSTLCFGHNSSLSLRNDGPCHHNVFSASCVALEPLEPTRFATKGLKRHPFPLIHYKVLVLSLQKMAQPIAICRNFDTDRASLNPITATDCSNLGILIVANGRTLVLEAINLVFTTPSSRVFLT